MATKTVVVVTDDIDHSTDNVGTHRFALDGVEYEIDLSPQNLQRMREALAPYVAAGRRVAKRPAGRRRRPGTRAGRSPDTGVRAAHRAAGPTTGQEAR
ncbi:histone-like nucleoid-structuring protein Lsr2 [Micromonospora globbae]|uniref:Lsr2 family protein n=1 Tax=Micromonospora globbae TaxID=1894969 RepID=A0A420EQ75_9ACTN|nr:Lsr2 family protein [Micromonospora globbae]RKF22818.1 Lsr2 family protein [Micromonospora globbae]